MISNIVGIIVTLISISNGQILDPTDVTITITDNTMTMDYTFNFNSEVDSSSRGTVYPINVTFDGGACFSPTVSIEAENIDINDNNEFLLFYQGQYLDSSPYLIGFCGTQVDRVGLVDGVTNSGPNGCNQYTECVQDADPLAGLETDSVTFLTFFIYKSQDGGDSAGCTDNLVNVDYTITCQRAPTDSPTVNPTKAPTPAPTSNPSASPTPCPECPRCSRDDDSSEDFDAFIQEEREILAVVRDGTHDDIHVDIHNDNEDDDDDDYKNKDKNNDDGKYNVSFLLPESSQTLLIVLICMIVMCLSSVCCTALYYEHKYKRQRH